MKLFLIGGMEDLNFNYCYKITYESGETYDRRRNELSVEISKEDYKKIITGVLQERPIDQIEGISDVIDKMTLNNCASHSRYFSEWENDSGSSGIN